MHRGRKAIWIALLPALALLLAHAGSASATPGSYEVLIAESGSSYGIERYDSAGAYQGRFDSGAPAQNFMDMDYGADFNGDLTRDLLVSTNYDGVFVLDGTSGAYLQTFADPGDSLRQIDADGTGDVLVAEFGPTYSHRFDSAGNPKPAPGGSDSTFGTGVNTKSHAITVGPDGKIYASSNDDIVRFDTDGNAEITFATGALTWRAEFGPDMNGNGTLELYVSQGGNSRITAMEVLADPSNPTSFGTILSSSDGLNGNSGIAFAPDGKMYVANYSGGNITRYRLDGGSWLADPAAGQSGAIFASSGLANVAAVEFLPAPQVPEPGTLALLGVGGLALALRRRRTV